jgi:hypothetical protein
MDLNDCMFMCTRDAQLNIADKDVVYCFAMSKMTVSNESTQYNKYV